MATSAVIKSISSPRLSSYMTFFGCKDELECVKYYYWNQALSSELYILLSTIEVSLRNSIHGALSREVSMVLELKRQKLGKEDSGKVDPSKVQDNFAWYEHIDFFEKDKSNKTKRDSNGREILNETGKGFRKITHSGRRCLDRPPQVVVSKLEFGKWPYVLQSKWYLDGSLVDWVKLFPVIFPNYQNLTHDDHDRIIDRVKVTCKWRNRLAHLEPVWKFGDVFKKGTKVVLIKEPKSQDEVIKRLNREIRYNLQLLSWLCEDTAKHYESTVSYKRLLQLASHEGINEFSHQ